MALRLFHKDKHSFKSLKKEEKAGETWKEGEAREEGKKEGKSEIDNTAPRKTRQRARQRAEQTTPPTVLGDPPVARTRRRRSKPVPLSTRLRGALASFRPRARTRHSRTVPFARRLQNVVAPLLPRPDSTLGYIPLNLYVSMSLVTLGMYPYIWLWGNIHAFEKIRVRGIGKHSLTAFSATGFCAQLLCPLALCSYAVGTLLASNAAREFAFRSLLIYIPIYFFLILPMRCFHYFDLRWKLRAAVAEWDTKGMMLNRTAPSWFYLFLFGTIYIQHHINRLMGLGMPGFASTDELTFSPSRWIRDYVIVKPGGEEEE